MQLCQSLLGDKTDAIRKAVVPNPIGFTMNRSHFRDGSGSSCNGGKPGLKMSSPVAAKQENTLSNILSHTLRPNSNVLHSLLSGSSPSPDIKTRKSNVTFQPSFVESSVSGVPQELLHNLACSVAVQSSSVLPAWMTSESFEAIGCRDFGSSPVVKLGEREFVTDCLNTVKECTMQMLYRERPDALVENHKLPRPLPISSLKHAFFQQCTTDQIPSMNVLTCVYGAGGPHSFMNVGPSWGASFPLQSIGVGNTQHESNGGRSNSDFNRSSCTSEPPYPQVDFAVSNSWEYGHYPQFSRSPSEFQQVERKLCLLQPGVLELGIPTPDQDNGYSSLEEEHLKCCASDVSKADIQEQSCGSAVDVPAELTAVALEVKSELKVCDYLQDQKTEEVPILRKDGSKHVQMPELDPTYNLAELEENEEQVLISEVISVSLRPVCQNKLIADILGYNSCSSSDSDDSEDDSDSEKDDGFDSEGMYSDSDCSSVDSVDLELWNSFAGNPDPYDLFNFTAKIQTGQSNSDNKEAPEILSENAEAKSSGSERSSSSISESSGEDDNWDENNIVDSENMKLWNTFNSSQDPYNPFNFKAKLHTGSNRCEGKSTVHRMGSLLPLNTEHSVSSPSKGEDGFCNGAFNSFKDGTATGNVAMKAVKQKKVTFIDEVTEYYVCSQEDRKGPWEELARDRCRFQKRVQEVEVSISHCLTTEHRRRVLQRLLLES